MEIYNENIRDLIAGNDEPLDLREDPIKGPTVAGVLEVTASSTEEVMELLAKGNKHRTQEPTAANKESSRSHAVLQVRDVGEDGDRWLVGGGDLTTTTTVVVVIDGPY